jgi:outer membrane receptor protein involved in Fe transport
MRYIFTVLLFILGTSILSAQQILKGKVKDAETNEELIGASILIKNSSKGTTTDYNGNFKLSIEQLPTTIVVSYTGYVSQEIIIKTTEKDITIRLAPNVVNVGEVEVTEMRISEKQKQAPLTIESLDLISIKETPAANFYEGLSHLKGVDLTAASIGFKVINTRGFNSTSPVRSLQLIDGVDNQAPGLNFSLGNFLGASELDVLKVDLIVGASGAYYGPNAFNGVINMTTKNPFDHKGLTAQVKVGERNLAEMAVRFAQVFKNKKGEEKFAYKVNLFALRADDWEAENYEPTPQSRSAEGNPGGWDAVNIYGDESSYTSTTPGIGSYHRTGYREIDIVDYDTRNFKSSFTGHYKIKKDVELIYASNFGYGTTVYQGDNRFSLRDILFFQNRLEIRKDKKYFFRIYATNENAGNSYDAYRTALILQNNAKTDAQWGPIDYENYWNANISGRVEKLPGYPQFQSGDTTLPRRRREFFENNNFYDSFVKWHAEARNFADNENINLAQRFVPGTREFDSAFKATTSRKVTEGGSRFFDKSALYHAQGEYIFNPKFADIRLGASARLYRPFSQGTLFIDTAGERISNFEYGVYTGLEKKVLDEKLKLSATLRMDKNQNFDHLFSPAFTAVYVQNKNIFRFSFASAIRNPTLTDQYFFLNVGRATLIGNLEGYSNLVTVESFLTYLNTLNRNDLDFFNVDAVKPERVRTAEVGYRTTIGKKLFIDASYYYSVYQDFLGFKIGMDLEIDSNTNFPTKTDIYRVTTNSKDLVTTTGFSIGVNYYIKSWINFVGNYSWNVLDRQGSTDPIIPAFNTPEHKFNVGINGREINSKIGSKQIRNWGYSINYRWVEGFTFEGSPQFTGFVPTYDMIDAQINYKVSRIYTTFKFGASNLLNNKVIQVYGGPRVGRMIYFSATVDLPHWN